MSTTKNQSEHAVALLRIKDEEDSICIDHHLPGAGQPEATNNGPIETADEHPSISVLEGSEYSSAGDPRGAKISVVGSDGGTRATTLSSEVPLSRASDGHAATSSLSELTLDDNEAAPPSASSVLIRGGISDLQDAAPSSEEVLLNDTSSPSVSVPGPPVLSLPTDRPRVPQRSAAGAEWPFQLSKHLTQSIKILAQEHDVDMSAVLLAAWSAVLFRLSGQQEFNITVHGLVLDRQVMVAHRPANSSLRIDLSGDPSTVQLLKLLKIAALATDDHQLDIEQVAFRFSREEAPSTVGQELSSPKVPLGGFELQLNLKHEDDRIVGVMDYAMALFDSLTIERHVGYLRLMLMGMASDVMQLVSKIDIISPAERLLLFDTWNNQPMACQEFPTIHQLFEDQVKRTPKAIAIVHEDQKITYAELNARSNRLAHRLIQLGVRPDACVAICVDKSIAMIVGILAILKAGGAYVPFDPYYASDRLGDILIDAAPTIMVADKAGENALAGATLSAITLVEPNTLDLPLSTSNPRVEGLTSRHLAYIIYTSGSTGKPKGVMVEHEGVVNFLLGKQAILQVDSSSRCTQLLSIGFDAASHEILNTICFGGCLHLLKNTVRLDRDQLWNYLLQHAVTYAVLTPTLLQDCQHMHALTALRTVTVMGEAMPPTLPQVLRKIAPNSIIINGYGPTECCIGTTLWQCTPEFCGDIIPIGRPIPHKNIYLLDAYGSPVPLGAIGEIFIGGVGIARGYLNRPDLTAERFLADPFSAGSYTRMYKTGDLARYLSDGNLVYMGRNDDQIKIRGFRVELGEIEARLTEIAFISEAVVVAVEEGSLKRLIAYIILNQETLNGDKSNDKAHRATTLREHLTTRLPEYMIPAAFVVMDAFPLTPNGKLDRRALPTPSDDDHARQAYEAPQGEAECILASIWSDLLQIEKVSRHDSFFALGGHSLLAIQMISRLNHLGHSISVRSLFESPSLSVLAQSVGHHRDIVIPVNLITPNVTRITPEMLPLIDLDQTDIDRIVECVPGGLANIQDIYALSPLQDGILFHHLMAKHGDPYVLFVSMSFETRASLDQYLAAFQKIVNRHDILRTAFFYENLSTPAQVVWRDAPLSITEVLLDSADGPATEQLKRMFNPQSFRMDLSHAPLLHLVIAQEGDGSWVLVELLYHLIGDHSTIEIVQLEIQAAYNGQGGALPPAQPYRDLIAQVRLGMSQEEHEEFFKEMLREIDTPSLLFGITDVLGDGTQITESGRILPQDLNSRLRSLAKTLGVSVASLCHVAWALVISRTTGQQRVVFGTVLFGRMQAGTSSDRAMGLFINTLPIRVDLDRDSVEESVRATQSRLAALLEHEHAPLALAQRCSSVGAGAPLFSSLLNYRHDSTSTEDEENTTGMKLLQFHERTNYPFCLSVEDYRTSLGLTAQVTKPFDCDRVCGYMQEALESLVCALECSPNMSVAKLEALPKEERQLLLKGWNAPQDSYPDDVCLHQLFEKQVERTPEAIAVVHEDRSLSYTELNARANALAHRLIALGVQPDSLVAICVERSPEMIIGILAILKAGGAYVPLDPSHSSSRLLDILRDASPACMVADQVGLRALGDISVLSLPVVDPQTISTYPTSNTMVTELNPHHLAYIIFTSGSTGIPKGVMVEHQGIVSYVTSQQQTLQIQPSSRMAQFFSVGFDVSVQEIFSTLCFGGSLYLLQDEVRMDIGALWRYLDQNRITHVMLTPSVVQGSDMSAPLPSLSMLLFGGEPLPADIVQKLLNLVPNGCILNQYGPTEATVAATSWICSEDLPFESVPIGRPLTNKTIYLLDTNQRPVPLGAIGEIFIGGIGIARGYLNQPDLTAERFLQDPYSGDSSSRMYKTGDLARYLPDGNLAYMGRTDLQVKIRGFRIELGEIETRLREHPLVSEAVVIALDEGSNKRLVAYVIMRVAKDNGQQSITILRSYLAMRLPEYMVPAAFVRLDAFPLTSNGKLDRHALPAPEDKDYARQEYEAPQGEVEAALALIWSDLLHVERVSRHDSFFALGGHSLLAVRLINRISSMGANIPLSALFTSTSLCAFAAVITNHLAQGRAAQLDIVPVSRDQELPLSFAQQRLWFLAQLDDVSNTYHIPIAFRARGVFNRIAWQLALDALYSRHEALRSVFVDDNGQPHVRILPAEGLPLRFSDLRGSANKNKELKRISKEEASEPFKLEQGPLIRAAVAQLGDDDYVLFITMHHIVSDGWSSGIMTSEIRQLYTAYCKGEPNPLTTLTIQYPDYAAWQRQWLSGDRLHAQREHWRTVLSGAPVLINLPTDRPRPPLQSFKGDHAPVFLDTQLTNALRQIGQKHGVTLFMTILSAWSVVLSRLSGQDDIVIGTPSANRGRQEIEPLIGFFVNTLAMRVDLSGEPRTSELLDRVRCSALAAYANQDLPFEQVIEIVEPPRRMSHAPLFQVMFAWQNNDEGEWDLPEVQISPYDIDLDTSKFDLTLALGESGEGIVGSLEYATSLFDRSTIERHIGYFQAMLQSMVCDNDQSITTVNMLSPSERKLLLHTWNATQESYPDDVCLHQLFEKQVERTPEAIAVVHEDQLLSYEDLNTRANALAHRLIALGVQPDSLVAICVERSIAMIIGILAILKAGGAYVPFDPYYASDRLGDILIDAAPTIMVADKAGENALAGATLSAITLVEPNTLDLPLSTSNPRVEGLTSRHLAYIIYTSGSTGKPKGVMVEHEGVVNFLLGKQAILQVDSSSRCTQLLSIGFDAASHEILNTICFGGCLHLLKNTVRLDRDQLWNYLLQHAVTYAVLTPTLLQDCQHMHALTALRTVTVMGEAMPPTLPQVLRKIAPNSIIINGYGPTECCIGTTLWQCTPEFCGDIIPIGRPIPHKNIYLLDAYGSPVPLGAIGEIFIGGVGIARGYLNRPDLTAERFLADPFSAGSYTRMYKTGDLARYLSDGNLVYMGRNDDQIKIRGFRVELGEIEARLREHPLVSKAVVIALGEGSNKRLVAYVIMRVAKDSGPQSITILRSYLALRLPEYMVPAAFVRLDAFPLTSNGKLDRHALPAPGDNDYAREDYEEPQGEVEVALALIWSDLLHVERVSRHDSFFALGGHSLLAVRLINRISSMGANIPLSALFTSPSLCAFAAVITNHLAQGRAAQLDIVPVSRDQELPLSFAQQRLWFLAQLDDVSNTYHIPIAFRVRGGFNRTAWQLALDALYSRHEALRSVFVDDNGQPHVRILPAEGLPLRFSDLRGSANKNKELKRISKEEASEPFKLEQGPLIRAAVAQLGDEDYVLFITMHHIVSDGWSSGVMASEIRQLYTAYCKGEPNPLTPLAIQYPDYAAWQRQWLSGDRLHAQREHWRTVLSGAPVLIDLPTDRPRPPLQSFKGDHAPVFLDTQLTNALRQIGQKHGVTLFMTILSAWSVVLSRLSGQDDVVIGTPSANRGRQEIEPLIGFFVNTLAMRVDLSGEPHTSELLDRVRCSALAAYANQDLPFEQVIEIVEPPRRMSHAPLFQVMFAWQNNDEGEWDLPEVQISPYDMDLDTAKFDLTLALGESGDGIVGSLEYATSLFDRSTIERHIGYLQAMLQNMVSENDQSITTVNMLSPSERKLLLHTWNATQESYPDDDCLHQLFEQQVERTPEAIAVVHEDRSLSYAELNARANALAHRLIALGVQPDSLVAICVERSPEMIIGILAILKAGGAYVPLDPSHASSRLLDILRDASPACMVADQVGLRALGDTSVLSLPVVDPQTTSTYPTSNTIVTELNPHHLAYIIFTSGSTGIPKGVMVEHQGIVNCVTSQQQTLQIQPSSRMAQFFSVGFDVSVQEIFSTLCFGGSLYLLQDEVRMDIGALWRYLDQNRITHVMLTPSVVQGSDMPAPLPSLSMLLFGGEPLPADIVQKLLNLVPNGCILNQYGPTEATVAATSWICSEDLPFESVPIGRPLTNKTIYLLDTNKRPVPLGAIGEIFIGGIGIARGYLNQPDLTAERFLQDPYSGDSSSRMYKTGDLARYLPDGNLAYIGRNDLQVKIRGFRVELGEIETRLREHPLVSEAVVIALDEDSNKRLVAYVIMRVAKDNGPQSITTLRSYLAMRLPEYMVPAAFVRLDAFPLTSNGKLDRHALPAPEDKDYARQEYEAPQGEVEAALALIWSDLLHVERVSRHDSFFALGGHSLLAVRLINRISSMGANIPLSALFTSPSLCAFAAVITNHLAQGRAAQLDIVPVSRDQELPLSFAQQRLWFLAQLDDVSNTYHIPIAFRVRGGFNRTAWQLALDALYSRHEALRSVFVDDNGQPHVRILPAEGLPLRFSDLRGSANKNKELKRISKEEASEPFKLEQGPLIRAAVAQLGDEDYVLFITMHHIVSDGWSSGVMASEIRQLYTAYCKGEPNPLTPLAIQYPDYAAWQRQWLSGDRLHAQREHWRTVLSGAPVLIDLPTDRPRPPLQSFKGDHAPVFLDTQLTNALRQLGQKHEVTLFMTILSAWSVVLSRLSGQDDIVIGTPSANRGRQEIEPLIGFFVNTLAMRVDLSGEPRTSELLDRVRCSALAAYANQDLPFEQVIEIVQPPRRMSHAPLFQVMFAWQNNDEGEWNLPEVQISPYDMDLDTAKFDLTLALGESGEGIVGSLVYATSLFDRSTIERHIGYFQAMLQSMVSDNDQSITTVNMLSPSERKLLLHTWNATQESYPDDDCLHQLFEQQVERTPEAIAVVHEDRSLSYAELNARANALAHRLIALGVQPDSLVAICVERSPEMIIGILAILKAGGAYVPLDPSHSSSRLLDILRDASPACMVADQVGLRALGDISVLSLPVVDPQTTSTYPTSNTIVTELNPHHLAYIIFTSGSTGIPKGVMVEHQGIVNCVTSQQQTLQIQPSSRMAQFFSVGFDVSVQEIFSTLCFGGSLYLLQDEVRMDIGALWRYLDQNRITHVMLTPSVVQGSDMSAPLPSLSMLLFGGEPLPTGIVQKLLNLVPNGCILNQYGPTEATVAATSWICSEDLPFESVPIGRPLTNKTIYLLDTNQRPVPLGAIGEIFIGGIGIARGYLNQPDLTAERFLQDPYSGDSSSRMYKTGDLARYLPDGNLAYIGRNDLQVKIRGFRIELGEIETRLREHPLVSKAVVIALGEGSNKRLVAYVIMRVAKDNGPQSITTLRSYLAMRLPEYMVPAAFVRLDAFPLTPNGKLDIRALPAPGTDDYARQAYEAPQGEVECVLASIWSDLLQIEKVSRHDSFFALGGHSLLAIQMISRLNHLGHSISVRSLFESPSLSVLAQSIGHHREIVIPDNLITPNVTRITPEMLPLIDLHQTDINRVIEHTPGGMANIQDIYALSPLQDGILFHHLMAKSGDPYVLFVSMSFESRASLDRYLGVIQKIVDRHDILRTAFVYKDLSTPAQVVWREASLSITEFELDPAAGTVTEQLKRMFDPQSYRMDLTQAPLLRFVVAQEGDGSWILVELLHHLIGDHSTLETMQLGIQAYYKGHGDALPPAQPYRNLIAQARLGVSQEEHEKFFKEMLAEMDTPSLPFGITDVHGDGTHITESRRMLPQDMNDRLRLQAKRLEVSVASLCHVAWALVIARTSGQEQVVFGTVLFGRMQAATSSDRAMGLFINTLPIRVDLDRDSVEESVRSTHFRLAALLEHEHASLALAQSCSSVGAGMPLFSSILNYRHNSTSSADEEVAEGMKVLDSQERTNYPFCLSVEDQGTSIGVTIQVLEPLEADRVCGYMQEALKSLVGALEDSPCIPVARLEVLPVEERKLLLHTWNATQESYPDDVCLHQLFEKQVDRTPEAIAVVHEDRSLSYTELNARANALAHRLIALGVQPDSLVAICVERSPEMIIGILAILKAGGAYVPLDPSHSSSRLLDILRDASPACMVADQVGLRALGDISVLSLPVVDPQTISTYPTSNTMVTALNPHHLAYIIFTSGSTGIPKGVMVEHQGIVNYVISQQQTLQIQLSSRMAQFFSVGFDVSVQEIFSTLCFGGSLYLLQDEVRMDIGALWRYLDQNRITHVMLTPSVVQGSDMPAPLPSLSMLLFGGEPLPTGIVQKLLNLVPNGCILNQYGPTEATVAATSWICSEDLPFESVPIGRPLTNKTIYLLDTNQRPVPLGAIGEIFIGGIGIARGYLNQPDLTAERFLQDPYSGDSSSRMYKTGDLARYLPDGNLAYIGRNDLQVKIRGFRIELGEIETRLREHPLVSEAAVIVLGEGCDKRLVAYVVTRHEAQSERRVDTGNPSSEIQLASILRSHLSTKLPEYMIPAAFVCIDSFPLTRNGKLDRKALPAPGNDAFAVQGYEVPKGELENILSSIWGELLNVERVGRHDGFFALGGQSLLAIRMIGQIRSKLGFEISLRTLFEAPTIAELSPRLLATGAAHEDSYEVLLPIKPQGTRPALFCIHPSSGLSWGYSILSTRLDPAQPLYGLQARGFIGGDSVASTLDDMALDYIVQIRRIQPHGPYHLLGFSFGGLVAHTMASHLEEQGERVALVALMDTPAGYHNQERHAADMDGNKVEQDLITLLVGNKNQYSTTLMNPFLQEARIIFQNILRISHAQAPRVIRGDVLIFRATVPAKGAEKLWSPEDWKSYVLGKIDVCDIECLHSDMYSPEPSAIIAQVLNERLK